MDQSVDLGKLQVNALKASGLLKSMANEWRLMILCQLIQGEASVGELERITGMRQSALSQHLAILRRERLVETRRSAQTIYYSIASDEAVAIVKTLYELFCGTDE